MNRKHIDQRGHLLAAASLALSLVLSLLLTAGVGKASADEEKNFCYGATVKGGGYACSSATYSDMFAAFANSGEGRVCLSVVDFYDCSKKANEGVYLGRKMGQSMKSNATIINWESQPIKVYGTFWRKSWHEDNLGGTITSNPEIISWGENRLDVFARGVLSGSTGPLWHRWWGGSGWSSWEFMGGAMVGGPGAVSWGSNQIDVVQVEGPNNTMNHWYWDGSSWKADSLSGSGFSSDPDIASWSSNRLDVFVRGEDNELWTKVWDGTTWSGWISLAGVGPKLESGPGAVSWGPGRIDVVARVSGGNIGHWWYDGSWHYGQLSVGGGWTGDPDIASPESGKLMVVSRTEGGYIYQRLYSNGGWDDWWLVGGPTSTSPSAVAWSPHRIDVVAGHPADNSVHHWWWQD